jgi:hypothetical protein
MSLVNELKERRTAVSAEMDRLEEEGREIDRKWKEQERLFGELDTAITALDPTDPPTAEELFDDEPAVTYSILTGDPCVEPESGLHGEPIEEAPALNEAMQDEREQAVEGYAHVVTPEAQMFAYGITSEQKPERKLNPFSIFRREPEDAL